MFVRTMVTVLVGIFLITGVGLMARIVFGTGVRGSSRKGQPFEEELRAVELPNDIDVGRLVGERGLESDVESVPAVRGDGPGW